MFSFYSIYGPLVMLRAAEQGIEKFKELKTMQDVRKIKRLKSEIREKEEIFHETCSEFNRAKIKMGKEKVALRALKNELEELQGGEGIKVSEHAMLRYLERVKGIPIDALEEEIINESLKEQVKFLGGDGIFSGGEYRIVMKNKNIVTITK